MSAQYFAELNENNVVLVVAVTSTEFMEQNPDRYPGRWVETFIDTPGKTYAGVGYVYDEKTDNFYLPELPDPIEPL